MGAEVNHLNEEMVTALDSARRIELIETFLFNALRRSNIRSEPLVEQGMQHLYASKGRITIHALAEK